MTKLNDIPFTLLQEFAAPNEVFPQMYIKNKPWEVIIREYTLPNYILSVLYEMYDNICKSKHNYIFVDVKTQVLLPGQNTANGHWHLDSSLLPDFDFINQIFVSGINRTEFVTKVLDVPYVTTSRAFSEFIHNNISPGDITVIPENTIIMYNGRNVHRGVMVRRAETRLLIRMITTDKFLPQQRDA